MIRQHFSVLFYHSARLMVNTGKRLSSLNRRRWHGRWHRWWHWNVVACCWSGRVVVVVVFIAAFAIFSILAATVSRMTAQIGIFSRWHFIRFVQPWMIQTIQGRGSFRRCCIQTGQQKAGHVRRIFL